MQPRIPKYVPTVNATVKFFAGLGVKTGPVNILTVSGRKSGRPRSTPVTPWVVDGKRYIITRNKAGGGFLMQAGVAPDRTPDGFAAAAGHATVFEVTPA
jgi:hypothetical protein